MWAPESARLGVFWNVLGGHLCQERNTAQRCCSQREPGTRAVPTRLGRPPGCWGWMTLSPFPAHLHRNLMSVGDNFPGLQSTVTPAYTPAPTTPP